LAHGWELPYHVTIEDKSGTLDVFLNDPVTVESKLSFEDAPRMYRGYLGGPQDAVLPVTITVRSEDGRFIESKLWEDLPRA